MEVKAQDQIAFYLTGHHNGSGLLPLTNRSYRPALFARHADLTALRYDFPLILNVEGPPERAVLSLSGLVDEAVDALQNDADRDRIAQHGYQLERELRRGLSGHHTTGTVLDFATMWNKAAAKLGKEDATIADSAKRLWMLFKANGELVDVDFALPSRVVRHVWNVVQADKARIFHERADRLVLKLHSILDAEAAGSNAGRSPEKLRSGLAGQSGTSFSTTFNFDAMSRILVGAKPSQNLSETRRRRIQSVLDTIERQHFHAPASKTDTPLHSFAFYRCASALQAYKERRNEAIELLKAMAIAELEVSGEYREAGSGKGVADHDAIFADFGVGGIDASMLATLPDYLVCQNSSELGAEETLEIVEALSTGLPVRVLVQTDDLLEPSGISRASLAAPERHLALASRSRHMLDTAIGLTDVFVLQSSAAQLFRLQNAMLRGMSYAGPCFFSVFSGSTGHNGDVPAYLVAAAATESRAFPSIVFDPSAGSDWATRLVVDSNPSPHDPWPVYPFEYESGTLEMHSEDLAFTLADFMAMDERYGEQFAIVPQSGWSDVMTTISDSLSNSKTSKGQVNGRTGLPNAVPCISLVDGEGRLQRAIVNRRALEETRRSQSMWRSLQELGGINNSHARIAELRADERFASQITSNPATTATPVQPAKAQAAIPVLSEPVTASDIAVSITAESHGDDPYIETPRCTTCNECTQVNDKLFVYNAERQASIGDVTAGTFRQLVEAAEGCQVSIIHPGKPRNLKEPGIEDLMKRAAQFN